MFNNITLGGAILVDTNLTGARGFFRRDGGAPDRVAGCQANDPYFLHSLRMRTSDLDRSQDDDEAAAKSAVGSAQECFAAIRTGDYEWASTLLAADAVYKVGTDGDMIAHRWSLSVAPEKDPAVRRILPPSSPLVGRGTILDNLRSNAGKAMAHVKWEGCTKDENAVKVRVTVFPFLQELHVSITFSFSGTLISEILVEEAG